jgi:hypothetical protein
MRDRRRRGQATMEYVLLLSGVIIPLTFGLIAMFELLWVWHTAAEFTRLGARYAATHCWQAGGENVTSWMRSNVPIVIDREQFQSGGVEIQVQYYKKNAETGLLEDFSCDGECSVTCIPDAVTVRLANYEFRQFVNYLGLPAVTMPNFFASLPIESAGCDPEQGVCLP